jgi:hypothetical protein
MTDFDREAYAAAQRLACMPMECTQSKDCWVALGGREALRPDSMSKTPRCGACNGKLLLEMWSTPHGLRLPPHGRLLTRGKGRSRKPDNLAKGLGDRAVRGGVSTQPTPASGAPS